jgi:hypothetical protein
MIKKGLNFQLIDKLLEIIGLNYFLFLAHFHCHKNSRFLLSEFKIILYLTKSTFPNLPLPNFRRMLKLFKEKSPLTLVDNFLELLIFTNEGHLDGHGFEFYNVLVYEVSFRYGIF